MPMLHCLHKKACTFITNARLSEFLATIYPLLYSKKRLSDLKPKLNNVYRI
jgi:hypothetical protein